MAIFITHSFRTSLTPGGRLIAVFLQPWPNRGVLGPTRLIQFAVVSGLYALLILVAAWGTWLGRRWGEWLLVALLALALPLEIMHAWHEQSPRTFVVLGLTVLGLVVTSRRVWH